MKNELLVVGAGNMGFAMISTWRRLEPEVSITVVEPDAALADRVRSTGTDVFSHVASVPLGTSPQFIILAVKPQIIPTILPAYRDLAAQGACVVSVAAGTTMATLIDGVGHTRVVRCMPNMPVAIGEGVLACIAHATVDEQSKEDLCRVMSHLGDVHWLADEPQMDAVTAISGSGPAYVFHFIECLTEAGVALGLDPAQAGQMASQTVAGAGRLARISDVPVSRLREQVTSAGGTTAAALDVLMARRGLADLIMRTAAAARNRSMELRESSNAT